MTAAIREENSAELLAIMPEAAPLIQRGELQHLPALFDALRSSLPALADCKHQFFTENMDTPKILGPCSVCGKTDSDAYKQGFTGCIACGTVRCKPCAVDAMTEQHQRQSLLCARHEINNMHTWTPSQEDCDLCGRGPCGQAPG